MLGTKPLLAETVRIQLHNKAQSIHKQTKTTTNKTARYDSSGGTLSVKAKHNKSTTKYSYWCHLSILQRHSDNTPAAANTSIMSVKSTQNNITPVYQQK